MHLLLVGFMLMIVMGVATWMFPRPARDDGRYRPELAEAVYWVMTLSHRARALAELSASYSPAFSLRAAIAVGGLGQVVGTVLFVVNMWTRGADARRHARARGYALIMVENPARL